MFDYKKLLTVFSVNGLNLLVGAVLVLVLPKFMYIKDYSFWQLYLFYIGYIGIFHLGWIDGLYLSLGGKNYAEILKNRMARKSILLLLSQIFFAIIFYIYLVDFYNIQDDSKVLVILFVSFSIVILNTRHFFTTLLQASNRLYEYSIVIASDRLFFLLNLLLFFLGVFEFELRNLLVLEIVSKFFSLILASYLNRKLYFYKQVDSLGNGHNDLKDVWVDIKSGGLLLIANYASIFILGVFRWGIEWKWGVEVFGRISLILSISNLILAFLSAISIVLYPILRKVDKEKLSEVYIHYRFLFGFLFLALILLYFPLYKMINYWLPQYKDAFLYFVFIFPICIFEGKVILIFYTFLKVFRREKVIFYSNMFTLIFSVLLAILCVKIFENLEWAIYSILVAMFLKCSILEFNLNKIFCKSSSALMFYELMGIVLFIYLVLYFSTLEAFVVYFIVYFIALAINKKRLLVSVMYLKNSKI